MVNDGTYLKILQKYGVEAGNVFGTEMGDGDDLRIADRTFRSRLFLGTGKFPSNASLRDAIVASGTEIVTVALRRVDIDAPGRVLQRLFAGADYVVEQGLPVGGAVEGIRAPVLRLAAREATDTFDREHVTPFVRERPTRFRVVEPIRRGKEGGQ
jgi:hypothetical protein